MSPDWQHALEIHPADWRFPVGKTWIAGWLVSRTGRAPADVRAWIRRLEEEAGQRRAEALAAMAKEEDWKIRPELESKASPAKEEANEAE